MSESALQMLTVAVLGSNTDADLLRRGSGTWRKCRMVGTTNPFGTIKELPPNGFVVPVSGIRLL